MLFLFIVMVVYVNNRKIASVLLFDYILIVPKIEWEDKKQNSLSYSLQMLFFQNLNFRWFHRDLFPGIQFKNGEVRAPPATRVLMAGSWGGYAHVVNEK